MTGISACDSGWSDSGRIEVVCPIMLRWRVGSGAAVPALPIAAAIASEPDLQRAWKGPTTLVELGPPTVGLPLGGAQARTWAAPALRRILHYPLADLPGQRTPAAPSPTWLRRKASSRSFW